MLIRVLLALPRCSIDPASVTICTRFGRRRLQFHGRLLEVSSDRVFKEGPAWVDFECIPDHGVGDGFRPSFSLRSPSDGGLTRLASYSLRGAMGWQLRSLASTERFPSTLKFPLGAAPRSPFRWTKPLYKGKRLSQDFSVLYELAFDRTSSLFVVRLRKRPTRFLSGWGCITWR